MYCRECGTRLEKIASFCPHCGTPVVFRSDADTPLASATPAVIGAAPHATLVRERHGLITLGLSLLGFMLVFAFEVLGVFVGRVVPLDPDTIIMVMSAVGATLGIVALGGARLLMPSAKTFRVTLRTGWWAIFVSAGLMVYDLVSTVTSGNFYVVDDWALRVANLFVLCVAIGVAEEGMFRGLLLGGLLDAFGTTKRGLLAAVVVASLLFGAAHVEWWGLNYADPLSLAQAVLKTLQTGTYGFYLAAVVISSGSIMGPAFLHGFDDFILLLVSTGFMGYSSDVEYVSTGDDALPTIILYCVMIVLYLPLVVQGAKMLRQTPVPERGALHKVRRVTSATPSLRS